MNCLVNQISDAIGYFEIDKSHKISPYYYHISVFNVDYKDANITAINKLVEYAQWSIDVEIYREIKLQEMVENLKNLKNKILKETQLKTNKAVAQEIIKTWLSFFHLTPSMIILSPEESTEFQKYLYANKLLVECEQAAVRRSPDVWSQIENRMLRPV
jgi:uncharacterized protein (DUF2344 family)